MAAEQQKRFGEKKQKQVVRFSSVNVIHCYDRKLPVTKRLSFGKEDTLVCPVWTKKAASAIAKLDPQTLETLVHVSTRVPGRRRPPSCPPPKSKGAPSSSKSNQLATNITPKTSKRPDPRTYMTKKFLGSIFPVPANVSKCCESTPPPGPPPPPRTLRDRAMAMAIELSKKNSTNRAAKTPPALPTPALYDRTMPARQPPPHPPPYLRSSAPPPHARAPPSTAPPANTICSPSDLGMTGESRPPVPPPPPSH